MNDFLDSKQLLEAGAASYLKLDSLRTPMGSGVLAVSSGRQADSLVAIHGGRVLTWPEVLRLSHENHTPVVGLTREAAGPQRGS